MSIRIGVATHPAVPMAERGAEAAAAGADFLEIMLEGPGERRRLADRRASLLDALPDGIDLCVHLPFGGVDVGAPLEHVRAGSLRELEACIDLAADLGAEKAVVHADSGVRPEHWAVSTVRDNIVDAMARLRAHGEERGVEVCAENVPGEFFTIETITELLERTDCAMTLDTGHARVSGLDDTDVAAFVAEWGHRISHVHLNDTRGPRDEHLPVGMGTTDVGAILDAFPAGWGGTLTIEAITDDFGFVEPAVGRLRELLG